MRTPKKEQLNEYDYLIYWLMYDLHKENLLNERGRAVWGHFQKEVLKKGGAGRPEEWIEDD